MRRYGTLVLGIVLVLLAAGWRLGRKQRLHPSTLGADSAERAPQSVEQDLSRYLDLAARTDSWSAGLEEMRRGMALSREEDHAGAASAFEGTAELLPGLADWSYLFAAETAARAGDTAAVQRLLSDVEPVLARERGWKFVVQAQTTAGDTLGALEAARIAGTALENGSARAEARNRAAQLYIARRDTTAALDAFRQALDAAPQTSQGLDAARALARLPGVSADDRLHIGRVYLRHGEVDAGVAALDTYLRAEDAAAEARSTVRLETGRALFRARRYSAAETRLAALARGDAPDSVLAEASLLVGLAQYRRGRVAEARATFDRTAKRFPRERAAAEALFLRGDMEHDAGRLDRAREYYREVVESGVDPEWSAEAAMRLGGLAFLAEDHSAALRIFEAYRSSQARGPRYQQASYWAGRTHLALGQQDLARLRLQEAWREEPASYYGARAADLLGDAEWTASLKTSPASDPLTEMEVTGALARLDALEQLDLAEAAAFEMERLKRYFAAREGGLYSLAEGFQERGRIEDGILLGREVRRGEEAWNDRLLRIVYPFPYRDEIMVASGEQGIDPFLVAGLIRQESAFNPKAVSPAGAVGLMQIMPATGRALGRKLGIRAVNRRVLQRPEDNIRMGTLFFADLLKRYDGRLTDALAAYNAGPRRLAQWRDQPEYQDEDLFAERIPFAETRGFVKAVRQNARLYTELYGGKRAGGIFEE